MYEIPISFNITADDHRQDAHRWAADLDIGRGYDKNVPFRPLLTFILECLHEHGFATELTLPDYYDFEDFIDGSLVIQFEDDIDGTMVVQSFRIFVYFEYSLSYLSLSAEHEIGLRIVEACTNDRVFLHEGYGLTDGIEG